MGMQTVDELKDLDPKEVGSTVISAAKRPFGPPAIEQHPTDETRTIDTSTADLPSTEAAEEIINNAPRAPEAQEVDTGGVEAEAPDELSNLTFDAFILRAEAIAKDAKVGPDVFDAAVGKLKLSNGGGKRKDMEARAAVIEAMRAGGFDWKTAKMVS